MEDVHDHDHHRMDDDGGCVKPPPVKIGIAPATADARVYTPQDDRNIGRFGNGPVAGNRSAVVLLPNGRVANEGPAVADLVGVTGETLNSLTWDKYLAWRKTKCRPFDYENGPALATKFKKPAKGDMAIMILASDVEPRARAIDEIDQAVLELIGEVAELGELFLNHGPIAPFFEGERREKLIDECGDIFFCGAWAMDAWGENPMAGSDDLELLRVEDGSELAGLADAFINYKPEAIKANRHFSAIMSNAIQGMLVAAQTAAGLLANSFKKLKFQRREQDVEVQIGRIAAVLTIANQILVIANSSVEEALKSNMRKLDARFPNGYQPGQGGGIRTGAGK